MGERIANTALPWAKQHDAKLSICKYTFDYKPLGVRSIPWETVESVKVESKAYILHKQVTGELAGSLKAAE